MSSDTPRPSTDHPTTTPTPKDRPRRPGTPRPGTLRQGDPDQTRILLPVTPRAEREP